ncbi:MAG TPA: tRNA lysidine(34) synthetase TilS, partial [Atribacterota bacterium]|nr:tRNA lysidine(34) synthetase TilS [Atribacterota bacterium]
MDKLIRKVLKTIEKYSMIEKGDMIILAISGGPDSTCLLDILNQIKEQFKISLMVAHVHHGIRKKEADVEARFVRLKSFHLGLPFQQKFLSVPRMAKEKGLSIEQAGRRARYEFFLELADKYQAQKIALGHHADDQIETILMRLIRGSGLRGLRGIPPKRGVFIRPLIECTREEIEAYCKRRKLTFCFDSTNKEPMYLRNKIR